MKLKVTLRNGACVFFEPTEHATLQAFLDAQRDDGWTILDSKIAIRWADVSLVEAVE